MFMITRRKLLGAAAGIGLAVADTRARAYNPRGTLFIANRWDAWYGTSSQDDANWYAQRQLETTKFRLRAPFFASAKSAETMAFQATQDTMDAEITYAIDGRVGAWCFGRAVAPDAFSTAFSLFQSSTLKLKQKWCYRFGPNARFYADIKAGALIPLFAQPNYVTVLAGRPLICIDTIRLVLPSDVLKGHLATLREQCVHAGLGNPYITNTDLTDDPAQAAATMMNVGADAISSYAAPHGPIYKTPYAKLQGVTRAYWAKQAAAGAPMFPIVMAG